MAYYRSVFTYSKSGTGAEQLQYVLHPEGLVAKTNNTWEYRYFKRDHVGSTRVVLAARSGRLDAVQSTDYYPFGLAHGSLNELHLNRYLYGGKEYQDALIGGQMLGLYDFHARYYNPMLGRWFNQDPRLQTTNPYLYCGNSPMMYTDPDGEWFGLDDLIVGALSFVTGYLSHGFSTGNWGKNALVAGGISAASGWLAYNTAGMSTNLLAKAGVGQGAATVIGGGVGSSVGSFTGNIAGQAYFNGCIDMKQAMKSALYGFGHGIGAGIVDMGLITKRFPMHHSAKYMARSIGGEVLGSAITGDWSNMTFGINAGLILPFASDLVSLKSVPFTSKKINNIINENVNEKLKSVGVEQDMLIGGMLDYGVHTKESGRWLFGEWRDDVGIIAQTMVASGGIDISNFKIGNSNISFPNMPKYLDMSGLSINIPVLKLPFTYTSAIHAASSYSMSHNYWKPKK